ncbi:carbonic anhydrase [Mrakia frigida]|uniref:carbonic anhydrase n=1 Tax=Mrakia frigida TaxID=29902 RepID=UPI003FCC1F6A
MISSTNLLILLLAPALAILALLVNAAPIPRPEGGFAPLNNLLAGNEKFRTSIETTNPGLLSLLTESGQAPQNYMLACSDSRGAPEVFTASAPGTMFTDRNIANQFPDHNAGGDNGAATVMTYAVEELGVKHIVIMGHYGCGGVAAAIASPPAAPSEGEARVQAWIQPIRELWASSTVPEIVAARAAYGDRTDIEEPDILDPAFRKLVEENVKLQVSHAATDPIIVEQWEAYMSNAYFQTDPAAAIWVHGMVYDIGTGVLTDLNISRGPGSEEGGVAATEGEVVAAAVTPEAVVATSEVKIVSMPGAETPAEK